MQKQYKNKNQTMNRRFIAEQEIFSVFKRPSSVAVNAVADRGRERSDIIDLPLEQRKEIYDFITGYNDRFFAFGNEEESAIVISSLYPSSSLCASLRFPFSASVLKKLVCECGREKDFTFSRYAEPKTVRISKKIKELLPEFSKLCEELENCFGEDSILNKKELSRADIETHCYRLSYFVGCPIELEFEDGGGYGETDIALLTVWLMTVLMFARNKAPDRSARLTVASRSDAVQIKVELVCESSIFIAAEINEWQRIAADKNMIFDRAQDAQGRVSLIFHPYRYDWSLLGIKQDITFLE